jgi:hypothetical protein
MGITTKQQQFIPTSICLQDDAAHAPWLLGNIETWYYDATFDNSYSMACVVNVMHLMKTGLILAGLFIYKDTHLLKEIRTRTLMNQYQESSERPHLVLNGRTIIDAEQAHDPKQWTYYVALGDKKNNVDLRFLKSIEGWRGTHLLGDWLVAPRLETTGSLMVDGSSIQVSGIGYHDHNNYPLSAPLIGKGANFGKIIAGPFTVVWAQVFHKDKQIDHLLVINTHDSFLTVPSDKIQMLVKESMTDRGTMVPTNYNLQVHQNNIDIDVDIKSLDHHYLSIPSVRYWRHHAKNTGQIRIGSQRENVSDVGIIDQLTFNLLGW